MAQEEIKREDGLYTQIPSAPCISLNIINKPPNTKPDVRYTNRSPSVRYQSTWKLRKMKKHEHLLLRNDQHSACRK